MKMYAQVGTLWDCGNLEDTIYLCGSYAVACKRGSAEEVLVSCLLSDNFTFIYEDELIKTMKMFRWALNDWKLRMKIHPKRVVKSLVDSKLFITGEGENDIDAVRDILDKTSFWAWVYPGAGSEADEMLRANPDYFFAVLNPQTLSKDEERIYNLILERAKENKKVHLHEVHHIEHYIKYYVTIDSLEKMLSPEGITRNDIYIAVEKLYEKHCIILHHKVPQYTDYSLWDFSDRYVCFPVGEDIGLAKYTPSVGELYRMLLAEHYRENAEKSLASIEAEAYADADAPTTTANDGGNVTYTKDSGGTTYTATITPPEGKTVDKVIVNGNEVQVDTTSNPITVSNVPANAVVSVTCKDGSTYPAGTEAATAASSIKDIMSSSKVNTADAIVNIDNTDYYVIATKEENGQQQALLLSKTADSTREFGSSSQWEASTIRTYLNGTYLTKHTILAQMAAETTIYTGKSYNRSTSVGDSGFTATTDKVFLLSEADVFNTVNGSNVTKKTNTREYTTGSKLNLKFAIIKTGDCYWLRSPRGGSNYVAYVNTNGTDASVAYNGVRGVRPALWVKL